ncbi:MAG: hypothetical protein HKN92_08875 [Chitinophagales bacterium]|nr:hypothetical protein [Chitinophagales bacterium]
MQTKNVYLSDLHFEHKVWANELRFVKDEISIFETRLEEVVSKNTSKEILSKCEHYQNQFIREKEVIDEIMHEITKHEDALNEFTADNPVAVDHQNFRDHKGVRESIVRFRTIYKELKDKFAIFLSETL